MNLHRGLFAIAASLAATAIACAAAQAEDAYPSKPIRMVSPFAAGGPTDIVGRIMGNRMGALLGQQFVVENRTGAGGNIAAETVVRAPPDGYTLLTCASANAVNASLYENLDFNFIRDIAPVAGLVRLPLVLIVSPSVPSQTVADFIAYAKANPGKINFASAGNGTAEHLAGELFKAMTGVDMVHVPFRGGAAAMTALLGAQVQAHFCAVSTAIAAIKSGMRPLAVTATTRWSGMPDVPTVADFVPGYTVDLWFGIGAPKGTPPELINRLNKEINAGLADATMNKRFTALGEVAMPMTPDAFSKLIAAETEKWGKIIREARIKT